MGTRTTCVCVFVCVCESIPVKEGVAENVSSENKIFLILLWRRLFM